jgi:hypothetical protein
MEAHPRQLKSIFRSDVRLTVPLFQRPYVWNADTQWEPLWEDVLTTRDRVADGDGVPHFLGAIVLEQQRGSTGSLEVREVIDGQQRLTTLQLLIAAVRANVAKHGIQDRTLTRLTKLLENDPDLVDAVDDRHKLWPTNRDRDTYRQVMSGAYRDVGYTPSLPRIAAAYTWFSAAIDEMLATLAEDEVGTSLLGIAEVLLEHLQMVVIDLDESDNAQIIFETLNARGTPLRASDLIKNLVFRTLQDAGRPVEELYETHWAPLETQEWQVDIRQGRLKRPRLDAFMGFFLVVLLQREVQSHQLFDSARGFIRLDADRAERFLQEMSVYARVYEQLEDSGPDKPTEAASLERMRLVDTQTLTPLLLWLFANIKGDDRVKAVLALESYVVRRMLCRLTNKNYNRIFLDLLRRLGTGEGPAGEVVTQHLETQSSGSGIWPVDEEVERSLARLPLYRLLKREQLQRVLLALEAQATTARTEPIPASRKMSIEHLLPQQWEANWPLPVDPNRAEEVSQERQELIHTIGNLTLVSGVLNSVLSNSGWSTKRTHLLAHSAISLNRSLPEEWDTQRIQQRSQHLARLVVELWQRPMPTDAQRLLVTEADRDLRPQREEAPAAKKPVPAGEVIRRDIGKHVQYVFAALPAGTFLTINEIRKIGSPEYGDSAPSAGAISARLFPASGIMTIPGIMAEMRNGIRGASKLDPRRSGEA